MNRFNDPDTTLIDKIARLEARLRRTRNGLVGAWLVVLAMLLYAGWPKPPAQVVVDQDRLLVMDDAGQVRATLGMDSPSTAGLALFDARGRALVQLTTREHAGELRLANGADPWNHEDRVTLSAGVRTRLALRGAAAEQWRFEATDSTSFAMRYPNGETAFTATATTPGTLYTDPRTSLSSP